MRVFYITLFCLISISSWAQKLKDIGINVRIIEEDKTIVAEIRPVTNEPALDTHVIYFWYGAGMIHQTQGGFSGKLLNGDYREYYLNKNLKTQGTFYKGQKTGEWKNWDNNGVLQTITTYYKGIKSGNFYTYDSEGKLITSGEYMNGKLEGKVKSYENGNVKTTKYKGGKVVEPKTKPGFWDKINIFKKIHKKKSKPLSNK